MIDPRRWQVSIASKIIARGGVIAYPTETVYGLGCNPNSWQAVLKILKLKGRSLYKGFIVLAANHHQLASWLEPDSLLWLEQQEPNLSQPTTWILPCTPDTPAWITGNKQTIAVRITDHPIAKALCLRAGPIISTSANKQDQKPATSASKLHIMFKKQLDGILPGIVDPTAKSSRIIDAVSGQVLRP